MEICVRWNDRIAQQQAQKHAGDGLAAKDSSVASIASVEKKQGKTDSQGAVAVLFASSSAGLGKSHFGNAFAIQWQASRGTAQASQSVEALGANGGRESQEERGDAR